MVLLDLPSSNFDCVGFDSLIIGWHALFGKMTEFYYFGGSFFFSSLILQKEVCCKHEFNVHLKAIIVVFHRDQSLTPHFSPFFLLYITLLHHHQMSATQPLYTSVDWSVGYRFLSSEFAAAVSVVGSCVEFLSLCLCQCILLLRNVVCLMIEVTQGTILIGQEALHECWHKVLAIGSFS